MSSPLFASHDGGDVHEPGVQPAGLRLSDAEQIAADRLDSAGNGSLMEALGVADAADTSPAGARLTERIDAIRDGFGSVADAPLAAAAPLPDVGAREALYLRIAQPAEDLAVPEPLPCAEADTGLHAERADATGPAPAEMAEAATVAEPIAEPVDVAEGGPDAVAQLPAEPTQPSASAPDIASAIGAATQLAADATAASEAIENLKRLLQRQLPDAAARTLEPPPQPAQAVAQAPIIAPPPPPPQPPPLRSAVSAAASLPKPEPVPMPMPAAPIGPERQRLDVRGFLAGFALSWAIGAVIYIYLMAG